MSVRTGCHVLGFAIFPKLLRFMPCGSGVMIVALVWDQNIIFDLELYFTKVKNFKNQNFKNFKGHSILKVKYVFNLNFLYL